MEINNTSIFLIGVTIIILGVFVIIFDYPQIQYFDNMPSESYLSLDREQKDIHQRLKIEFGLGITILSIGIIVVLVSLFKKSKN